MKKKNLKKIITSVILGAALTVSVLGCGGSDTSKTIEDEKTATSANTTKKLRFGVQPGSSTLAINDVKHVIEDAVAEYGVEIEYVEFTYGPPILESMTAGDLDLSIIGNLPLYAAAPNGSTAKAIYKPASYKNGADSIVVPADSDIENVEDLIGKKIGVSVGSAAHSYLSILLEKNGYKLSDVEVVNIAAADMATALTNKEVDAVALWETTATKTEIAIGGKQLFNSNEFMPDQVFVIGREEYINENPEVTAAVLSAIRAIEDWTIEHQDEAIDIVSQATGDSKEAWKIIYEYELNDGFTEADYEEGDLIKKFLLDNGYIESDYEVRDLFVSDYWDLSKNNKIEIK